jgi:hypothetical protein
VAVISLSCLLILVQNPEMWLASFFLNAWDRCEGACVQVFFD